MSSSGVANNNGSSGGMITKMVVQVEAIVIMSIVMVILMEITIIECNNNIFLKLKIKFINIYFLF